MKKIILIFSFLVFILKSYSTTYTITPLRMDTAFVGHVVNVQLRVPSLTVPKTYSVISGRLPYGITMNTAGNIQGTVPLGSYTLTNYGFCVKARNMAAATPTIAVSCYTMTVAFEHPSVRELTQIWTRLPFDPAYQDVYDTWNTTLLVTNTAVAVWNSSANSGNNIITLTANYSVTATTTLTANDLTYSGFVAGETYIFDFLVYPVLGAGGMKIDLSGTAFTSNLLFIIDGLDGSATNRITNLNQATDMSGYSVSTCFHIFGTVTISTSGSIGLRIAQQTSNAASSSLLRGSSLQVIKK